MNMRNVSQILMELAAVREYLREHPCSLMAQRRKNLLWQEFNDAYEAYPLAA